jgi:hypothetical protein
MADSKSDTEFLRAFKFSSQNHAQKEWFNNNNDNHDATEAKRGGGGGYNNKRVYHHHHDSSSSLLRNNNYNNNNNNGKQQCSNNNNSGIDADMRHAECIMKCLETQKKLIETYTALCGGQEIPDDVLAVFKENLCKLAARSVRASAES